MPKSTEHWLETIYNQEDLNHRAYSAYFGDVSTPAGNTAAVLTYDAPGANRSHIINGVAWSYSAAPANGQLTITDNGATVFAVDIIAGGPDYIPINMEFTPNSQVILTLGAGGGVITGKLNVMGHRIRNT